MHLNQSRKIRAILEKTNKKYEHIQGHDNWYNSINMVLHPTVYYESKLIIPWQQHWGKGNRTWTLKLKFWCCNQHQTQFLPLYTFPESAQGAITLIKGPRTLRTRSRKGKLGEIVGVNDIIENNLGKRNKVIDKNE